MSDQKERKPPKMPTLSEPIQAGAMLIAIDAYCLGDNMIAGLVAIGLLLVGLPLAFLQFDIAIRKKRLRNLGIYLGAVVLVFTLNYLNNLIAAERARTIIVAAKAYYTKNHHYPQSLEALVPDFLDHVPAAKYTLGMNTFFYHDFDGAPVLYYLKSPPYGRPAYRFAEDKWGYMD